MKLEPKIVAEGWVDLQSLSGKSVEHYIGSWAEDVLRCAIECDSRYSWEIIKEINNLEKEDTLIGNFSAGPIEDFLDQHGEEMIEEVVSLARKDPKFNYALGGVWKSSMTDNVWNRIEEIRNHVW